MTQTQQPPRVAVFDLDGVLADFVEGFTKLASALFDITPYTTHEQTHWDGLRRAGLSRSQIDQVWEGVDSSPDWWETLQPLTNDDDLAAMHDLVNDAKVKIIYATNRSGPDNVVAQSERWLSEYGFPYAPVVATAEKAVFVQTVKDTGVQIVGCIEDSPYNIERYTKLSLPVYVRTWAYNEDVCPDAPRVKSVEHFCGIIREIT